MSDQTAIKEMVNNLDINTIKEFIEQTEEDISLAKLVIRKKALFRMKEQLEDRLAELELIEKEEQINEEINNDK